MIDAQLKNATDRVIVTVASHKNSKLKRITWAVPSTEFAFVKPEKLESFCIDCLVKLGYQLKPMK
jgi:hypothetical protein